MIRVLKRDLTAQFHVSRNLHESLPMKAVRIFWACVYVGKALVVGCRGVMSEQIGSSVVHDGKRLHICNWAGSAYPTLAGDGLYLERVPRDQITNIISSGELWHRFTVMFEWYMGSWHGIDVNKRLYPHHFECSSET